MVSAHREPFQQTLNICSEARCKINSAGGDSAVICHGSTGGKRKDRQLGLHSIIHLLSVSISPNVTGE